MLNRRHFLRGLFAAPAVVAANNLMPIRGLVMPVPRLIINPTLNMYDIVSLHQIRDLLMPGLREIKGSYASIHDFWERELASGVEAVA